MKKKLIVYDFDKTIYSGETSLDVYRFYFKKYPLKTFIFTVGYIKDIIFYLIKIINLKQLKERYFQFLESHTNDEVENLMREFWTKNKRGNYKWVDSELIENKKEADLVIVTSASPTFIIKTYLLEKGYDVIFGTDFLSDSHSKDSKFIAKLDGENNKHIEKVKKLEKWAKKENIEYEIIKFYSDSLADKPLFDLADKKVWIKHGKKVDGMPKNKTIIDILFWK